MSKTIEGAIALAISTLIASQAGAQVHPEKPVYAYEKCYGVAKQAMNDCFFSGNSCAGTVATDSDPGAWIYLPKGTCGKLAGGSTAPPKGAP